MGQGDFFLEYPKLHELAASKNPFVRTLHDFLVNLNPEPHRRVFLKPFMRTRRRSSAPLATKFIWMFRSITIAGFAASTSTTIGRPAESPDRARGRFTIRRSPAVRRLPHAARRIRPIWATSNGIRPFAPLSRRQYRGADRERRCRQFKADEDFLKAAHLTVDIFALSPAQAAGKSGAVQQSDTGHDVRGWRRSGIEDYSGCRRSCSRHRAAESGAACGAARRYGARRCGRSHEEGRPLLSRRNRGCLRHLARTESHRRQGPDDFLERHGRR